MTKRNPEYDFKWCPGCGDFGVKRAIEMAIQQRTTEQDVPVENNVVVAGIGCSGNMVHLIEGDQPFGFHGIHGRTLPLAFGVKLGNPDLDVLIAAGDGDFLSIGFEHIGPAAQRNLNVTAVVMDNGVYGLTKGQSSPTTELGVVTPTTPGGKVEAPMRPLELYLAMGVSHVASAFSSQVRELAVMIRDAMNYPGFSIVHVQSPCPTYNDTLDLLRGNAKKDMAPKIYAISEDHDANDITKAWDVARAPGVPLGLLYEDGRSEPLEDRFERVVGGLRRRETQQILDSYEIT